MKTYAGDDAETKSLFAAITPRGEPSSDELRAVAGSRLRHAREIRLASSSERSRRAVAREAPDRWFRRELCDCTFTDADEAQEQCSLCVDQWVTLRERGLAELLVEMRACLLQHVHDDESAREARASRTFLFDLDADDATCEGP